MTQKDNVSEPVKTGISARVKLALASLLIMVGAFAMPVAALTFDMNGIQVVLSNLSGYILPAFLDLVIASLPIIVTLAIIGFIVGFLDRILQMIKL